MIIKPKPRLQFIAILIRICVPHLMLTYRWQYPNRERWREYIPYCQDQYDLVLWGGGKLRPYNLVKSHYNWIFFPVFLQPGYYRIALVLLTFPKVKPVTAYAVIFLPATKNIENYPFLPSGLVFTSPLPSPARTALRSAATPLNLPPR